MEEPAKKPKAVVYSDYICPFCFIGEDRASRLEREFGIDVEWKGFEIHPETPKEGCTIDKIGLTEDYIEVARSSVLKLAEGSGLKIKFPKIVSNSRLAMEISEFAKEHGKFKEFNTAVFRGYWKDGKDIGDKEFLFDIAERCGLDIEKVKEYLRLGKGRMRLDKYLEEVKGLGITGVPTFLIGEQKIVGAQPYEVLKRAYEEEAKKYG